MRGLFLNANATDCKSFLVDGTFHQYKRFLIEESFTGTRRVEQWKVKKRTWLPFISKTLFLCVFIECVLGDKSPFFDRKLCIY